MLRAPYNTKLASHVECAEETKGGSQKMHTYPASQGALELQENGFPTSALRGWQHKLHWLTALACKSGVNTDSAFNDKSDRARSFLPMNLSFVELL